MHCVVNKDGIVVALFLLECDAQDFIHNCRTPYSRKDYTVDYREKYEYVTLQCIYPRWEFMLLETGWYYEISRELQKGVD